MRRFILIPLLTSLALGACVRPGQDPTIGPPEGPPAEAPAELSWKSLAPAPSRRTEVTAAAIGDRIFVIGGFAEGADTVATVEVYDIAADRWLSAPPLPVGVNHPMSAGAEGAVYVFGGYLGPGLERASNRGFVFAPAEPCPDDRVCGEWRELPRMPEVRAAAGAAAVLDQIFIAGGVGPRGLAETTLVFSIESGQWSTAPGVPTRREHLGVASFGDRVYVVGGRTGGIGTNLAAAEVFDPATGEWSALAGMPTPRGGNAAGATTNGFVVSVGGEAEATFDEAEAFDVGAGAWVSLPRMPTARHGLGVVGVETILYVIAGGVTPGFSFSDANEAVDLAPLR